MTDHCCRRAQSTVGNAIHRRSWVRNKSEPGEQVNIQCSSMASVSVPTSRFLPHYLQCWTMILMYKPNTPFPHHFLPGCFWPWSLPQQQKTKDNILHTSNANLCLHLEYDLSYEGRCGNFHHCGCAGTQIF